MSEKVFDVTISATVRADVSDPDPHELHEQLQRSAPDGLTVELVYVASKPREYCDLCGDLDEDIVHLISGGKYCVSCARSVVRHVV